MTPTTLLQACTDWDGEEFPQLVDSSFAVLGTYQRDLAAEFEVAESTVSRWANGIARPHPRVQKQIIASIRKRAQRAVKAQAAAGSSNASSSSPSIPMAAKGI